MSRPEYLEADAKDRIAYIGSRSDVLNKSFATDLWMKVIHRAIDDIVTYRISRENNKDIKEEELESINDAYGFLFHDEHKIPFDDYFVDIECLECKNTITIEMSLFAGETATCNICNKLQGINISNYTLSTKKHMKEINLREILQFWGIDDIKGFRSGVRERIEELIEKKKIAINKRISLKKERKKEMNESNKLECKRLENVEWREYDFEGRIYRINNPVELYLYKGSTTHRVVDSEGVVHCVPAPGERGCVLRWKKTKDSDKPVKF